MRFRWMMILLGLFPIVLGACSGESLAPVTPATNKLTFLFFYTDD
jgi:hypothetical protein